MSENSNTSAISDVVQAALSGMYTMLPGEIVLYDGVSATVRPTIKKKYLDGEIIDYSIIYNVPVRVLSTGRSSFSIDLLPKDQGLLFFSSRDASTLINSGEVLEPPTRRKFDYNDCFFIPFETRKTEIDTNYKPLSTTLARTDSGTINFKNSVFSHAGLMADFFDIVQNISTVGSPGNHIGSPVWQAQVLALKLNYIALSGSV